MTITLEKAEELLHKESAHPDFVYVKVEMTLTAVNNSWATENIPVYTALPEPWTTVLHSELRGQIDGTVNVSYVFKRPKTALEKWKMEEP